MISKFSLGQTVSLRSMSVGDIAVFHREFGASPDVAICADSVSRNGVTPQVEVFTQDTFSPARCFKGKRKEQMSNLTGWIPPGKVMVLPEFDSRITERSHGSGLTSKMLFVGKNGDLLIPVFDPVEPISDPIGWLSLTEARLVFEPERLVENLVGFGKWGMYIQSGVESVCIWRNE